MTNVPSLALCSPFAKPTYSETHQLDNLQLGCKALTKNMSPWHRAARLQTVLPMTCHILT